MRISAVITSTVIPYEFSPSEDTISREFGAYDSIRDNFPKYVVSFSREVIPEAKYDIFSGWRLVLSLSLMYNTFVLKLCGMRSRINTR